jgi:hypothetical protein
MTNRLIYSENILSLEDVGEALQHRRDRASSKRAGIYRLPMDFAWRELSRIEM